MEDLVLPIATFQNNLGMGVEEQVRHHPHKCRGQMLPVRFSSLVSKLEMRNRGPLLSLERVRHQLPRHPKRPSVVDVRLVDELAHGQELKGITGESRIYHVAKSQ